MPMNSGGNTGASGSSFPARVYSNDFVGINNVISITPIVAGGNAGLYIVSVYGIVTEAGTSGSINCNIAWNDVFGLQTVPVISSMSVTAPGIKYGGSILVMIPEGENISLSTTRSGTAGILAYDIYCNVMRL